MIEVTNNSKHCSLSIVPPDIGKFLTGMMDRFEQVDTDRKFTRERLDPAVKDLLNSMLNCYVVKACQEELYTRELAISDSQEAVDEVISNATHELEERIANIVHDAAKYKIPTILRDMSATRSYDNTCAKLLVCDALDQLRNLNLEGMVNEAARIRLDTIKDYANMQANIVQGANQMWSNATNSYEDYDEDEEVKHHLNSDMLVEVPILIFANAIIAFVLESIYKADYENQATAYKEIMAECGSAS